MTSLGKTLFSLLLVGAGFGLASVFGPPDLADRLADNLTLGRPADPWGDLRPASPAALQDQSWASFSPQNFDAPALAPMNSHQNQPAMATVPPAEPSWMTPVQPADFAAPPSLEIASTGGAATVRDPSVAPAAAQQDWGTPTQHAANQASQAPATPWPAVGWAQSPPATPWPAVGWAQSPPATQPARPSDPAYRSASYRRPAPAEGAWAATVQQNATPIDNSWAAATQTQQTSPLEPTSQAWAPASQATQSYMQQPSFEPEAFDAAPESHIVADGDTLASIAARYLGGAAHANDLFAWNRDQITHPDLLPIGLELRLSGSSSAAPASGGAMAGHGEASGLVPVGGQQQQQWQPTAPRARLLAPQPAGVAAVQEGW